MRKASQKRRMFVGVMAISIGTVRTEGWKER